MKYCDGCGEKATAECPYCHADSCDDCAPICDHDARKPPSTLELAFAKEPERSIIDAALRAVADGDSKP